MKKLWLLVVLVILPHLLVSAQTETKAKTLGHVSFPPFLRNIPDTTNIVTSFEAKDSDALNRLDASWISGESRLALIAWYAGTNLWSIRLSHFASERNYEWKAGTETGLCTFPEGTEQTWIEYAKQIRHRYQIIGENMFVELWPLKYLGKVERLTDGVVLENLLFIDAEGKYRIIDEGYWVGETPTTNEPFYVGSDGNLHFAVEKKGGKFLFTAEVFNALQKKGVTEK